MDTPRRALPPRLHSAAAAPRRALAPLPGGRRRTALALAATLTTAGLGAALVIVPTTQPAPAAVAVVAPALEDAAAADRFATMVPTRSTPARAAAPSEPASPSAPARPTPAATATTTQPTTPARPATPTRSATPTRTATTAKAAPATTPTAARAVAPAGSVSAQVAAYARAHIGYPYRVGTKGPDYYDCAGLVAAAFASAGVSVRHSMTAQAALGTSVTRAELQPGDIVIWGDPVSAVSVYIGNDTIVIGDGPDYGVRTVTISSRMKYREFIDGRRYNG